MQVTCFGLDWNEVRKRPDAQAIVEQMILTDDVDLYATQLPDGMWPSDSASLHFEVAEAVAALVEVAEPSHRNPLTAVGQLIATGESIDELGLAPLTDGCYFASLSPERVIRLDTAFAALGPSVLAELHTKCRLETPQVSDFLDYIEQWRTAIRYLRDKGVGLIGHCG